MPRTPRAICLTKRIYVCRRLSSINDGSLAAFRTPCSSIRGHECADCRGEVLYVRASADRSSEPGSKA